MHQVGQVGLHGLGRQARPQQGQPLGTARDDAYVGGVALVAAARPGQAHQGHLDLRLGLLGGVVPPGRGFGKALRRCSVAGRRQVHGKLLARQWYFHRQHLPIQHHLHRHRSLVHEEGQGLDQGRGRRPAAARAGGAGRPGGARRCDLAREDVEGWLHRVVGHQAQHHLARRASAGVGPVQGLGAQQFHGRGLEVGQALGLQDAAHALQDGLARAPGLGGGVHAHDHQRARAAKAVQRGGRHLVLRRGRGSAGTADFHPVGPQLLDAHLAEVAAHVGQLVGPGVSDLVEQLLGHGGTQHAPARALGLGEDEAAVGMALQHGVADVGPIRDVLPVGVQAARGLAAALDEMPGQAARGQQVVVLRRPAELVHQRPERHRAVHAPAGDDDVSPFGQRTRHGQRAQVGVGAEHALRQGLPAHHVPRSGRAQLGQQRAHVIAQHHGNARLQAQAVGQGAQRIGAALGVDAPGVGHHLDALAHHLGEHGLHGDVYEIGGVTEFGPFGARPSQHRHGGLGQVVEHQVVEGALFHELRCGHHAVAPEAGGAADADDALLWLAVALRWVHVLSMCGFAGPIFSRTHRRVKCASPEETPTFLRTDPPAY